MLAVIWLDVTFSENFMRIFLSLFIVKHSRRQLCLFVVFSAKIVFNLNFVKIFICFANLSHKFVDKHAVNVQRKMFH